MIKESQGQTATPPSSGPRERKLAPRPVATKMQDDQSYGQPDFSDTGQMQDMSAFMTPTPGMYGYPMSAPATAPPNFWDSGASFMNMDLQFAPGNDLQTPTPSQRHHTFYDGQALQDVAAPAATATQDKAPAMRRERSLAPKTGGIDAHVPGADPDAHSLAFTQPGGDPFGGMLGTVVNPGLIFGDSEFVGLGMESFQPTDLPPTQLSTAGGNAIDSVPTSGLRRSFIGNSMPRGQLDRLAGSSPTKANPRLGLDRSLSEARGKRTLGRNTSLAPAARDVSGATHFGAARGPIGRVQGRLSPHKIHHRQASSGSGSGGGGVQKPRASVAFHIDDSGRAHAETVFSNDDLSPSRGTLRQQRASRDITRGEVVLGSEDSDSSTDEEPIMLPSRNTSFALPDARQATSAFLNSKHSSKISISERSSNGDATRLASLDNDSEAETVTNEEVDATCELRRVMSSRHKRPTQQPMSGNVGGYRGTNMTPKSMPYSASQASMSRRQEQNIRCVCSRDEADVGDGFLVRW